MDSNQEKIDQLRLVLSDCQKPEILMDYAFLDRFLKARKYDVPKAEKMIRDNVNWRHEYRISTYMRDYTRSEFLKKYTPFANLGRGRNGTIVWYIPVGRIDYKGILMVKQADEMLRYVISLMEESCTVLRDEYEVTDMTGAITLLCDMENISMMQLLSSAVLRFFLSSLNMFADNYPEVLKKIFTINASRSVFYAHKIYSRFVDPATLNKIGIYTCSCRDDWRNEVINDLGEHILQELDTTTAEMEKLAGPVPVQMYLQ